MANDRTYVQENIIVGAADVFVGAEVEEEMPEVDAGASYRAALTDAHKNDAGWRHVGLTQGGVEFTYAPDFGEVEVDQFLDVAKMFKQGQTVTVSTTFAEATLENLLFTWGQPVGTLVGDRLMISGGALGDKPVERALAFVGQGPGDADERVYYLQRVMSVESSSFSLSKTEAQTIPVSLRCFPSGDLSSTVTYGYILDNVITVTDPGDGDGD